MQKCFIDPQRYATSTIHGLKLDTCTVIKRKECERAADERNEISCLRDCHEFGAKRQRSHNSLYLHLEKVSMFHYCHRLRNSSTTKMATTPDCRVAKAASKVREIMKLLPPLTEKMVCG